MARRAQHIGKSNLFQESPMIRSLIALAVGSVLGAACLAQTTIHYREGERVDPQDVARILAAPAGIKTRSIRLLDEPSAPDATGGSAGGASEVPRALSLPVRFDFDSADISSTARGQLDALAEGIKLLSPSQVIVVEGHTDALGSDDYNLRLSQRRATVVKRYLVQEHGIDPRRLLDKGQGESQPIDGLAPQAPQNRRVQFRGA
jgi:outer membrane protein OmpA-like peptidoglycan-associated protein